MAVLQLDPEGRVRQHFTHCALDLDCFLPHVPPACWDQPSYGSGPNLTTARSGWQRELMCIMANRFTMKERQALEQ